MDAFRAQPESPWAMVRRVAAAGFIGIHGVIHVLGFLAIWNLADLPDLANPPTLFLADRPVTDPMVRAFAVWWVVAGLAFIVTSAALMSNTRWWRSLAPLAALLSMVPAALWWADAAWGFLVSVLILLATIGRYDQAPAFLPAERRPHRRAKSLSRTGM